MADEKRELTPEEYLSLSPSDRAHYRIKGRLGDGLNPDDTQATKAARSAAFGGDAEAGKDEDPAPADSEPSDAAVLGEGVTGPEGEGHPQTVEEAVEAEEGRREEMSAVELEEAEARDRLAGDLAAGSDEAADASVPNVGAKPDDSSFAGNTEAGDTRSPEPGEKPEE
jgi:hypothetical protein